MTDALTLFLNVLMKAGLILLAANEVRGLLMAAPVFVAMYEAGGTFMAIWLGISSLGGIAISVLGPLFLFKKLKLGGKRSEAPA
jgi:hypothetical protein